MRPRVYMRARVAALFACTRAYPQPAGKPVAVQAAGKPVAVQARVYIYIDFCINCWERRGEEDADVVVPSSTYQVTLCLKAARGQPLPE